MVERLQAKASSIGRILTNLEKKYSSSHMNEIDMKKSPSGSQLGHPPNKRAYLKIQQIPPYNANKLTKSPSSIEPTISTPESPCNAIVEASDDDIAKTPVEESAKEKNEE